MGEENRDWKKYFDNGRMHLCTILKHKKIVFELCAKMGLYWQGLTHDLSKFSPEEFRTGIHYYQGFRSPNAAEREEKGYSTAWLHHKGRNKHHYEYWTDVSVKDDWKIKGVKMPPRYLGEMLADRIAASKVYKGDAYTDRCPWEYYKKVSSKITIHPETGAMLKKLLKMLAVKGEDYTLRYMKHVIRRGYY